jgi:hypothetical protein
MSGAKSVASRRARFQALRIKLLSLRLDREAIRSGNRLAADDAVVRENDMIERLCELVTVMRAEGDFHKIDDLLARVGDASCR